MLGLKLNHVSKRDLWFHSVELYISEQNLFEYRIIAWRHEAIASFIVVY